MRLTISILAVSLTAEKPISVIFLNCRFSVSLNPAVGDFQLYLLAFIAMVLVKFATSRSDSV